MKVLVADDDPGSLLVARAAVKRSGHDCLTAADGDEAWALYLEHQPDVVVTDWMMPGMDGLALCRAIRARGADLYTYIVLLTSQGSRDDVLAGLEAGADDYVTKPLDPFVLHARLLVALRVTTLHADLAHYRKVLSQQARTDPLTGLHNRLKLSEDLEQLHARSQRYAEGYCVAMCDVDNFKSYNDIYGHQAGDLALRAVAGGAGGRGAEERRRVPVRRRGVPAGPAEPVTAERQSLYGTGAGQRARAGDCPRRGPAGAVDAERRDLGIHR